MFDSQTTIACTSRLPALRSPVLEPTSAATQEHGTAEARKGQKPEQHDDRLAPAAGEHVGTPPGQQRDQQRRLGDREKQPDPPGSPKQGPVLRASPRSQALARSAPTIATATAACVRASRTAARIRSSAGARSVEAAGFTAKRLYASLNARPYMISP